MRDSFLFFVTKQPGGSIGIFDMNADDSPVFVGEKGNAKNEFLSMFSPYALKADDGTPVFAFLDYDKSRLLQVDVKSSHSEKKLIVEENSKEDYFDITYFQNLEGKFFSSQSITLRMTSESVVVWDLPYYTIEDENGVDTLSVFAKKFQDYKVYGTAASRTCGISPNGKKAVSCFYFQDLVNIIDIDTHKVLALRPESAYGFEYMSSFFSEETLCENINKYYTALALSSDKIFLICENCRYKESSNGDNLDNENNKLYVLNYQGECLATYFVDTNINRIAYCATQDCLYAICQGEEENTLVRLDFPK